MHTLNAIHHSSHSSNNDKLLLPLNTSLLIHFFTILLNLPFPAFIRLPRLRNLTTSYFVNLHKYVTHLKMRIFA